MKHTELSLSQVNELVQRAKSGDMAAQDNLMEAYSDAIHAVAMQYLDRGMDLATLMELAKKGFQKGVESFEESAAPFFTSHVVPIIRQEILKAAPGQQRKVAIADLPYEKSDFITLVDALESSDSQKIDSGLLEVVLSTLNEKERTVICCFYGIGGPKMSLEEISEKMGLTHERVRQIKEKVVSSLKKCKS